MESFLQSKEWADFQESLGKKVWRMDSVNVIKYNLPLGKNYLYSPRCGGNFLSGAFLKKIREILSKKGVLIFQIPNIDSLGFRLGKKLWFHLDLPRHLILHNRKSIEWLCKKTGFEIKYIKYEYYDYPLDLFWSLRKSLLKYLVYPIYPIIKYFSREHLTFICKVI